MTSIDDLCKIPFQSYTSSDQKTSKKKGALFKDKSNCSDQKDLSELNDVNSKHSKKLSGEKSKSSQ